MTFNELHKNWQSQPKKFTLTIDSDLLLKEVERNRKDFVSSIFWRDFMEVGVSIIMFFFFIYIGLTEKIWPMFLLALSCLWLASFMITDRLMQKTREPKFAKILTDCIQTSLYQVNHQIWLLKNVIWWYLLPPGVGIAVFMIYMVFEISKIGVSRSIGWISFLLGYLIFCFFLDWGIYLLNQRAVRKELFPRKEELEEILKSLKSNDA